MAKTIEKPVTEDQTPAAPVTLTFRDLVYTSRTLVIPESDRTYPVAKGRVSVPASNNEAADFLSNSVEFELLKE